MAEALGSDDTKSTIIRDYQYLEQEFELSELLGSGRFGSVYKVIDKKTGKQFAAKFSVCSRPSQKNEFKLEAELMSELHSDKLVQLHGAFMGRKEAVLVMELLTGGELFDRIIDDSFVLTEELAAKCLTQICAGIGYMHSKNILHLDLKPENVLCSEPNSIDHLKIIDLGLARRYTPNKQLKVMFGTPEFVAPEVVNFDPLGPGTDMWSVGVIAYVLLSGLSPFMGSTEQETLSNIAGCEWDFEDDCFNEISDTSRDFVEKLLAPRERERMTCSQCLEHPWLSIRSEPGGHELLTTAVVHLKKFVSRRKWARSINAVRALSRLQVGAKKGSTGGEGQEK